MEVDCASSQKESPLIQTEPVSVSCGLHGNAGGDLREELVPVAMELRRYLASAKLEEETSRTWKNYGSRELSLILPFRPGVKFSTCPNVLPTS